jgi:hypothetical protein
MNRIADHDLTLHLEVALSVVGQGVLADLQHPERDRRISAVSTLAGYLAERMRSFDINLSDGGPIVGQSSLFPDDLSPLR